MKSKDFSDTFRFTIACIDVKKDSKTYAWETPQFNAFKNIVKEKIIGIVKKVMSFANSPTCMEDSTLRPVMDQLLYELADITLTPFSIIKLR